MTVKEAFDSIVEDGIAKGAGDFVDPEALEVAAVVLAKKLRGLLVEVVRCKDCKHYDYRNRTGRMQSARFVSKTKCCCRSAAIFTKPDDFCSYGERKDNERKAD